MASVLIIEDDVSTSNEIAAELASRGHSVQASYDGAQGLALAITGRFEVITLDRLLPSVDGLDFVRRLRDEGLDTPVLMLSALGDVDQRIAGLRAGGDDYLVKPFAPDEMSTRVEALLRRRAVHFATETTMLRCGEIQIDLVRRRVIVSDAEVRLLNMEFKLLEFFMRNAGQVLSRRLIFEQVWGYFFDPGANLINVHVARLRKKLDRPGHPTFIQTEKGAGYRFNVPS